MLNYIYRGDIMNYLDYEGLKLLKKFIINPNILINPDFRINQRNGYITKLDCTLYSDKELTIQNTTITTPLSIPLTIAFIGTTYAKTVPINDVVYYLKLSDIEPGYVGSGKYIFDRWIFAGYTNIIRPNNNYVTLGGNYLEEWTSIFQPIDPEYYELNGKVVTFSMKIRTHTSSGVFLRFQDGNTEYYASPQYTGDWEIISITTTVPINSTRLYVGVGITGQSSGTLDIAWAKLEEGNTYTIFKHPEYSIELIKCRYYYQEIFANRGLVICYGGEAGVVIGNIEVDYMYRRPTYYFKNDVFNDDQGTYIQYRHVEPGFRFELGDDFYRTNVIHVRAYKSDHEVQYINGMIVITSGNPICLDAELLI